MFSVIILVCCISTFSPSCRILPGGREVLAQVIRVATPNNFYPCLLSLAAGFGLFHGQLLRSVTGVQLPVVYGLSCCHGYYSDAFSGMSEVSAEWEESG